MPAKQSLTRKHICSILLFSFFLTTCGPSLNIVQENADATQGITVHTHPWYNTDHHGHDDRFVNPWRDSRKRSATKSAVWLAGRIFAPTEGDPPERIEISPDALDNSTGNAEVFWVGHATTLIQHDGMIILTDPIFSERASPVEFAGPVRIQDPAIALEDLPRVDVVVVSHSHYDHLDRASILGLHEHFSPIFLVPLGMERILLSWGVTGVVSLDWWQYADVGTLRVHCTPARHWSTRRILDRNRTLWSSWYFEWPEDGMRIYFGGDTAYETFFEDIGRRLGSPNLAMMPIGAYEPRWFMRSSHVSPEEAIQAFLDLGAREFLGIHWGTFDQSDERLDEPPELTRDSARKHGIEEDRIHLLPVGGRVLLDL